EFTTSIEDDIQIPIDVFTTVVENLLDNARNKRNRELELTITVRLSKVDDRLTLSVCDTGSAIPENIHQQLFTEIVTSNDGFGIGLHQSYELAKEHGFDLSVENNVEGQVCFVLK
ncbi:MAG: ATP-binding protein, partial [Methylococcaceae bacterium]